MQLGHLLILFLNWTSRLVHPHPRRTLLSREISANPLYKHNKTQVDNLIRKIVRGEDINNHLSQNIKVGYLSKKPIRKALNKRKDLDMMLNDWGIHHVHIPGVSNDLLLFVIFIPGHAYILDIAPHRLWADTHFVEIAIRNWPNNRLFQEFNLTMPGDIQHDIGSLRNAGINVLINVDNKVYTSSKTFGITTAGTSTAINHKVMRLQRLLRWIAESYNANPEFFRPNIERLNKVYPSDPEFRLVFLASQIDYQFAIHEKKTDAYFSIHIDRYSC